MKAMHNNSKCFECASLYGEIVAGHIEYDCDEECPQCGAEFGCYLFEKAKDIEA